MTTAQETYCIVFSDCDENIVAVNGVFSSLQEAKARLLTLYVNNHGKKARTLHSEELRLKASRLFEKSRTQMHPLDHSIGKLSFGCGTYYIQKAVEDNCL